MTNPKGKILVVGDWFIDENWLMAKTDNYHSTDVGEAHYNSLIEGPGNFVLSVCGVASILKVLSGDDISDDERNNLSIHDHFEIIGAGVNWGDENQGKYLFLRMKKCSQKHSLICM